ncbi:hypothetical protein KY362_06790 [Candidatus Woesearchaeota archaeon]|nr:hypothetical protein [Candidatus Woesearchaeota archaeon]
MALKLVHSAPEKRKGKKAWTPEGQEGEDYREEPSTLTEIVREELLRINPMLFLTEVMQQARDDCYIAVSRRAIKVNGEWQDVTMAVLKEPIDADGYAMMPCIISNDNKGGEKAPAAAAHAIKQDYPRYVVINSQNGLPYLCRVFAEEGMIKHTLHEEFSYASGHDLLPLATREGLLDALKPAIKKYSEKAD